MLNEYLRTLVIFGKPYTPFNSTSIHLSVTDLPPFPIGEPIPKEFSFPLWDSTIAPEDRGPCFAIWVGTYFSPAVPDLSSMDIQALESRTNISQTSEPDNMAPTTSRMSVEELQSMTHPEALERSGGPLMELEPAVYWRVTERALFETDGVFASVDAVAIWCNMSVAPCVWAARRIAERAEAAKTEGKRGRKVDTVKIDGANHFVSSVLSLRVNVVAHCVLSSLTGTNLSAWSDFLRTVSSSSHLNWVALTHICFPDQQRFVTMYREL